MSGNGAFSHGCRGPGGAGWQCPLCHGGRWFEMGHRQHSGRNALPRVGVMLRSGGAARA